MLGSLVPLMRDARGFLADIQKAYGDFVPFTAGHLKAHLVSHPALIEDVLLARGTRMHKDAVYEKLRPVLGNGLLTAEDDLWKRNRKLAAPSLTPKVVRGYARVMTEETRAYAECLLHSETRDLNHDLTELTARIVLRTLFGEGLSFDLAKIAEHIETIMAEFIREARGYRLFVPLGVPTPGRRRARRATEELDALIRRIITERKRQGLGSDMLSRLIEARDDAGGQYDETALRDECITFFLAGHETTALTLCYALLALTRAPDWQQRLHSEACKHAAAVDRGEATPAELEATYAVVHETLRLYPPAWIFGRQNLDPWELGGHSMPPGSQFVMSPLLVHRDPRWYEDPQTFEPGRWLADGFRKALPRMAYLPFGGGPRICIGNHFAMTEAAVTLSTIVRSVRFEALGEVPPPMMPSVTMRPAGPVPVRVVKYRPATRAARRGEA